MASDQPDILEQALAEVASYVSTETRSVPYISSETDNLVQEVQALCTRLAEEGEETLFISVNVSGNQCAYLGSTLGKDYIENNGLVQGFFTHCNEKYLARQASLSNASHSQDVVSQQPTSHTTGQVSQQASSHMTGQVSQQPTSHMTGQVSQQPTGHMTGQVSQHHTSHMTGQVSQQATSHMTDQVSQQTTGHITNSGSQQQLGQMSSLVPPPAQHAAHESVSAASPSETTPGYRSLLTKASMQTLASSIPSVGQINVAQQDESLQGINPQSGTITPANFPTFSNSGASSHVTRLASENLVKGQTVTAGSVVTTATLSTGSVKIVSDKSIGTDFTEDDEAEPPKEPATPSMITKYVLYENKSDSKKKVLVYRQAREGTTKSLGLGESTGSKVAVQASRTETRSLKRENQELNQTSGKSTKDMHGSVTSTVYRTRSSNTTPERPPGNLPRTSNVSTPQMEDGTGPFHMSTRSGGKAKHKPWLNKWKDGAEGGTKNKNQQSSSPGKPGRKRRLSDTDDLDIESVNRRIKVEVESDEEFTEKPGITPTNNKTQVGGKKGKTTVIRVYPANTPTKDHMYVPQQSDDDVADKLVMDDTEQGSVVHKEDNNLQGETDGDVQGVGDRCEGVEGGGEHLQYKDRLCDICGEDLVTSEGLAEHLMLEHDVQPQLNEDGSVMHYHCDLCGMWFPTAQSLNLHSKNHTGKRVECSICGKAYQQARNLHRHIQYMHKKRPYSCIECDKTFRTQRQHHEHVAIKHGTPRVFICRHKLCGKTFEVHSEYKEHIKTHIRTTVCEFCGKTCRQDNIEVHRRMHTKEKPIKCKICGRGFARHSTLLSHKLTHRTYKAFMCEVCGRTFKTKESMRQHRKVHMKEATFDCKHCDLKFRTFDGMKNHMVQFHQDLKLPKTWNVYSCDHCPKKFGASQQFIRHMSIHTGIRPHKCDACERSYPTLGALNTHKKTHKRREDQQFRCNVCHLTFSIVSKMKRHIETAKHIQYCKAVDVDPKGNLEEYESKIYGEGKLRTHEGSVTIPADGSIPVVIKKEIPELEEYEGDETVECVLIHLPDDEVSLEDGAQIVYSINTEDGTIESVYHEARTDGDNTVQL